MTKTIYHYYIYFHKKANIGTLGKIVTKWAETDETFKPRQDYIDKEDKLKTALNQVFSANKLIIGIRLCDIVTQETVKYSVIERTKQGFIIT